MVATLQVSDVGLGTEIVYAGTVKVTRLFLVMGDLAIQLSGS
jgi:hypothetical protein